MTKPSVHRLCGYCGSSFDVIPSRAKAGKDKYCSAECGHNARNNKTQKSCLFCEKSFFVKQSSTTQRFCSKPCWYKWHKKENNNQYRRIDTSCYVCGKPLKRTVSRMSNYTFQYCSRKCSSIHHRTKISGENHPLWTGGESLSRGHNWNTIRKDIIARDRFRCIECGMTNDDHILRYRCDLNVHHKEPYRLTQNNNPDNLITLCVSCHKKAEVKITKALGPLDKLLMAFNTKSKK